MQTETLKINGFSGYFARPDDAPAPGIVVLQEIFGVNEVMRATCRWLAGEGFCALCPDLFWRIEPGIDITDQTKAEWEKAFDLFGKFDVDKGVEDIGVAAAVLRAHSSVKGGVGAVGFCLGGQLAYLSACRTDIDAAVGYYGVNIQNALGEAAGIKNPLMLHMAGADSFVPRQAQRQIAEGLKDNKHVTLHAYPEQEHAFARAGGEHFDKQAAAEARARTLSFLKTNL